MSSLRNSLPQKDHKERGQPHHRKRFGLLEKHKDYVERAKAYHKKEDTIRKLKEKAANKNPDEFNFGMIKSKTVNGVHIPGSTANKYSQPELMLMKTQDIGYILQKLQAEKKKIEKLKGMLHSIGNPLSSKHVHYAEDRYEAREIRAKVAAAREIRAKVAAEQKISASEDLPIDIKKKVASSYRELETRQSRVAQLEKIFMDMSMQKELQKKGRKRKLREDEITDPTSTPVYKWRPERKR